MNLEREFYELINIANQKDIIVLTNFRGNKYFFWNLSQKKYLLINEEETLNEKFYILCKILNQINLEDIYIKPYIREKIKSFSNQEKEEDDDIDISERKINYCEICKKPIFSDTHNLLNVCNNCFKYQVKYGQDFSKCSKEKTDNECLDCPIFEICKTALKQLYPMKNEEELNKMIEEKKINFLNIIKEHKIEGNRIKIKSEIKRNTRMKKFSRI
ncbi:MAG TPA: hypothetical protein PLD27_01660 [bacterium]|nr:hypothetical protein [bacterium]HOL48265.1 hypothetical protein [bacterium]HPQ18438.1 hypothetical protein [bacterium]